MSVQMPPGWFVKRSVAAIVDKAQGRAGAPPRSPVDVTVDATRGAQRVTFTFVWDLADLYAWQSAAWHRAKDTRQDGGVPSPAPYPLSIRKVTRGSRKRAMQTARGMLGLQSAAPFDKAYVYAEVRGSGKPTATYALTVDGYDIDTREVETVAQTHDSGRRSFYGNRRSFVRKWVVPAAFGAAFAYVIGGRR